jgi:hypothetical protein
MESPIRIAIFLILLFFNHFAFAIGYKIIDHTLKCGPVTGAILSTELFQKSYQRTPYF